MKPVWAAREFFLSEAATRNYQELGRVISNHRMNSVIRTMTASEIVHQSRNNDCEQIWSDLTVLAAAM
jgi:hypothetical protein